MAGATTDWRIPAITNDDGHYNETRAGTTVDGRAVDAGRTYYQVDDSQPQLTWRAVVVGLLFGSVLCFSNMYFGLQSGWISMMSLQASLVGFAVFKALARYLDRPLSPAENVVLQTTSVATATMPLAAGFVGVIPALAMLAPEESRGHLTKPSYLQLCVWALGVAFFGVFFAVPLRKQTIIREKLRFPSGTATAQMISVLHRLPDPTIGSNDGNGNDSTNYNNNSQQHKLYSDASAIRRRRGGNRGPGARSSGFSHSQAQSRHPTEADTSVAPRPDALGDGCDPQEPTASPAFGPGSDAWGHQRALLLGRPSSGGYREEEFDTDWQAKLYSLAISFLLSGAYTILAYIFPILSRVPIFGTTMSKEWLWYWTPSLSYAGQGIIMGLPTCAWMLVGAVVGWGVLSPIAHNAGWTPGPVDDWKTGSRGWILWVSLAVMIADSLASLSIILYKEVQYRSHHASRAVRWVHSKWSHCRGSKAAGAGPVGGEEREREEEEEASKDDDDDDNDDGDYDGQDRRPRPVWDSESQQPVEVVGVGDDHDAAVAEDVHPQHLVPAEVVWVGLVLSSLLCAGVMYYLFRVPFAASVLSVLVACLMAVLGVRALGETDLNPVSGIAKVSQFIFAGVLPGNLVGNIVAGAVAEAGAQQAGDLMQDLKTGHLLQASPRAQFHAQMIGSLFSAFVAAGVYKLYATVYEIPGPQFPVPTAQVWLDMARLVNGKPLPAYVVPFAAVFAVLFAVLPFLRLYVLTRIARAGDRPWVVSAGPETIARWWPSGIAFAIGIYNSPNFTLMRVLGALAATAWVGWYTKRRMQRDGLTASSNSDVGAAVHRLRALRSRASVMAIVVASGFVLGEGTFSFFTLIAKAIGG
ncbi:OPT super [Spiromyces aspiralis]|uniref:OPT super n=1 Tax=Spiromyces aspiralis TaxID=68401 RepID=A0ACC1HK34_9FUNG|nr:OPT super [Spiromyces aspiralis]